MYEYRERTDKPSCSLTVALNRFNFGHSDTECTAGSYCTAAGVFSDSVCKRVSDGKSSGSGKCRALSALRSHSLTVALFRGACSV